MLSGRREQDRLISAVTESGRQYMACSDIVVNMAKLLRSRGHFCSHYVEEVGPL